MTIFIIKKKQYEYLVMLAPALSLILVCVASPANAYFRYTLPYIISLPVLMAFFIYIMDLKKDSENGKIRHTKKEEAL